MHNLKLEKKEEMFKLINLGHPFIIAGPCSAESENQVFQTALKLSNLGIKVFRAGIWKPRTRPGNFEGVGSAGLRWLTRVKKELGLIVATEVANTSHVEAALKNEIDILWIGARTSVNPFAVQEIADLLRGVDIPVLVKNPINPDIDLWIGAIERINKAGIKKIVAVHRGFSTYDKSIYRNNPHWEIPIELKRRIPDIFIITDPSHISGNKKLLFEISQKAMDLNFDGLMIESHINPSQALSDASQQVTPKELDMILKKLIIRKSEIKDNNFMSILKELRSQIDNIDHDILNILEKRMSVVEKIGRLKKEKNISILQTKRWDEILSKKLKESPKKGLNTEFILKIFEAIHEESINHQFRIMND